MALTEYLSGRNILSRFPDTRISLILRLASAEDADSWREFASNYAPAVFAIARRRGLQPADAEDFVQELLLAVARAAGRWQADANRARFRTWLFRIARNLLADHFRHAKRAALMMARERHAAEATELTDPPAYAAEIQEEFELEYRRALFHRAAALVRLRVSDLTWDAFASTAIDATPAVAVSQRLGMSVGSVYVARSRVMKMLRSEIERMEADSGEASEYKSVQVHQEPQL